MAEPGNIDVRKQPVVRNPDGSVSNVRSMSVNMDGKEVLLTTVNPEEGKIMSPDEAVDYYRKTGKHLGKFESPEEATEFGRKLHESEETRMEPSLGVNLDVFKKMWR